MSLIWMNSMKTGVEWQDNQHVDLINQINGFIDAMSKNRGEEELSRLFRFLDNYMHDHFKKEEIEMDRLKYSDALPHKDLHKQFFANMNRIKGELKHGEAHTHVMEARKILADWFNNHIVRIDKKLGAFILENQ